MGSSKMFMKLYVIVQFMDRGAVIADIVGYEVYLNVLYNIKLRTKQKRSK